MHIYYDEPSEWFREGDSYVYAGRYEAGYRDRIDQWNPYNLYEQRIVEPITEITYKGNWYSNHRMSNYLGARNFVPANINVDAIRLSAIAEFASIVKSTDLNMAVLTAEIGKTGSMIANRAHRVLRSYRSIRKGKVEDAVRLLFGSDNSLPKKKIESLKRQDPANTLLELQYGWRPLMSDIFAAAQFSSLEHDSVDKVSNYYHSTENADLKSFEKTVRTLQKDNRVSATGQASRKTSLMMSLDARHVTNAYRLGLNDPALIAYELVPGSFILDWFSNLSDYLEAVGFAASLGGVTFSGLSELSLSDVKESIPSWNNGSYNYGSLTRTTRLTSFRRHSGSTVDFPPMHIELKSASNLLSKTATTVSLLVQQASR